MYFIIKENKICSAHILTRKFHERPVAICLLGGGRGLLIDCSRFGGINN